MGHREVHTMQTKTKMGRPLSSPERLNHLLQINVSENTRRQLEAEAEAAGYRSLSSYIREHKLAEPALTRSA